MQREAVGKNTEKNEVLLTEKFIKRLYTKVTINVCYVLGL